MLLPYNNRSEAGRELANALQLYANRPDVLVLTLPLPARIHDAAHPGSDGQSPVGVLESEAGLLEAAQADAVAAGAYLTQGHARATIVIMLHPLGYDAS
jgi:hypothetical protein